MSVLERFIQLGKKIIPKKMFAALQPPYHRTLSYIGAALYGFPSRHIFVVGVTGTKGKTTVVELINAILEEAGYTTALSSTLRFKIADRSERNLYKMTMPGRFFLQQFLRQAVLDGCTHAILEMTSEGTKQFRHRFIELDALVFTNLSPEHIESHGSFEAYREAKIDIARRVEFSKKKRRTIVVNRDDPEAYRFLELAVPEKYTYSLTDVLPYEIQKDGIMCSLEGTSIQSKLIGEFNLANILAAAAFTKTQGIAVGVIKKAIEKFEGVRGRVEFVNEGQLFAAVVDYAHTPDSLEKFYGAFVHTKNICILGNTGGGRDTWKRPEMARIAEKHCEYIYLTNEDPYNEDPRKILADMESGLSGKNYEVVMDRRLAIRHALKRAASKKSKTVSVLITGKGTDPYIMGPGGSKTPWDDATVVREELRRLLSEKTPSA